MKAKNKQKIYRRLDQLNEVSSGQIESLQHKKGMKTVMEKYDFSVTDNVMKAITGSLEQDPVALQYMPQTAELLISKGERADPIGDDVHSPVPGIVHRHKDRVLLMPTTTCAVYCRYCFRKEKIGSGAEALTKTQIDEALAYIRNHSEIWEVILTGGDPLVLSAARLKYLMDELQSIKHIETIRIHSRVPIAAPDMVSDDMIAVFGALSKPCAIVLHVNHAAELTEDTRNAVAKLHKTGVMLLSQSVLLKNVNDKTQTLETLFRELIKIRVKPYYLHHPDMTPGTNHFRVTIAQGQAIMAALRKRLSGISLPQYVLDIPGGYGKIPVHENYITPRDGNHGYDVRDHEGRIHLYEG